MLPFNDAAAGSAALDLDYPDHRTAAFKPLWSRRSGLDARGVPPRRRSWLEGHHTKSNAVPRRKNSTSDGEIL